MIKQLSGFLFVLFSLQVTAQNWTGLNQSNYSGSQHFFINTAQTTSSPYMIHASGVATGLHLSNDYLTYNMPFSMGQWIRGNVPAEYKNADGKIDYKKEWFEENLNGQSKNMNLITETRGPAFMYNYNRRLSVGVFTRTRVSMQVHDMDEKLARIALHGIDSSGGSVIFQPPNEIKLGEEYGDNAFTLNMNAFSEIGIGGAYAFIDNNHLKISGGANLKYLMGLSSAYIRNNGVRFSVQGYDSIQFGEADFEYGYVEPSYFENLSYLNLFNGKSSGTGFGVDLSAYIELKKPKGRVGSLVAEEDVEYFFRGGISLLDVGSITYSENVKGRKMRNETPVNWMPGIEFAEAWQQDMVTGIEYTDSVAREFFEHSEVTEISTTLPTAISIQGDLKIIDKFYVGFHAIQSLKGKNTLGMRRASAMMLMPRYESEQFEVSVPFTLVNDYKNASVGLFLRLGPFFAGTDNLLSSAKKTNFNGLDYYFGISYGFGNSRKDFN